MTRKLLHDEPGLLCGCCVERALEDFGDFLRLGPFLGAVKWPACIGARAPRVADAFRVILPHAFDKVQAAERGDESLTLRGILGLSEACNETVDSLGIMNSAEDHQRAIAERSWCCGLVDDSKARLARVELPHHLHCRVYHDRIAVTE